MSRKKISFFFLFLCFGVFTGFSDPKNPKDPVVQQEEKKSEEVKPSHIAEVRITFFDSKLVFQGQILISNFSLSLVTHKNGFDFFKEMDLNDVRSIEVLQWKGSVKSQEEGLYTFVPVKYQVTDRRGTVFIYEKNIPALNQFVFESSWGKTRFFSYYYDYLKKDRWESTGRKGSADLTTEALAKVVKKIEFLAPQTSEQKKS